MIITNGKDKIELLYDDFDYSEEEFYYNGEEKNSQIGFSFNIKKGMYYIESIYFNIINNDIITLDKWLINKKPNKKSYVKLSNEDYQIFLEWYRNTKRELSLEEIKYYKNKY